MQIYLTAAGNEFAILENLEWKLVHWSLPFTNSLGLWTVRLSLSLISQTYDEFLLLILGYIYRSGGSKDRHRQSTATDPWRVTGGQVQRGHPDPDTSPGDWPAGPRLAWLACYWSAINLSLDFFEIFVCSFFKFTTFQTGSNLLI